MIAEHLNRNYVIKQAQTEREQLEKLLAAVAAKDAKAIAALRKRAITPDQIRIAINALGSALETVEKAKAGSETAYIPSNPTLCAFQAGMTLVAQQKADTEPAISAQARDVSRSMVRRSASDVKGVIDTSPTERLKVRSEIKKAAFVENDDVHYGLDGFFAKFGTLFEGRRKFNKKAARIARSTKPLRLFIFGDWGTGLPLAQMVTGQIRQQIEGADDQRQQHVVHLGDVYYVGDPEEYTERVLSAGMWPVNGDEKSRIGSWSLNGNHDMYSGGYGYFDHMLKDGRFLQWHQDENGKPSSFFLIEDEHWQFFGLDTSWNIPSLGSALLGVSTLKDYGGQNGILTEEQAIWMAKQRNPSKGCVLLTHHQAASSRSGEDQHSDEAVKLLEKAGVYDQIDGWIWGHEHRCVVFKPKQARSNERLRAAPEFCACIGHGGVPVTKENFEGDKTIADVAWQEDRCDKTTPLYVGERILPFGFARVDTVEDKLDIRIYDHTGAVCYQTLFSRNTAVASSNRSLAATNPQPVSRNAMNLSRSLQKPKAAAKAAVKSVGAASAPSAEWTILVYMAGDNNLDTFGLKDLKEMKQVGSTKDVQVVVQRDSTAEGGHRYFMTKGEDVKKDIVATLGDINSGDSKVLEDFLLWGIKNYPAKRYMAVLWNHGNGWDDTDIYKVAKDRNLAPMTTGGRGVRRGAVETGGGAEILPRRAIRKIKRARGTFFVSAFETKGTGKQRRAIAYDDSAQDFLDSVELKEVFTSVAKKQGRKFDVIGMDACLMSMVENGLQVQDGGEVFCGSQEIEPGNGWPYDVILKQLVKNPAMDGGQLSSLIVREFVASYPKSEPVTQSAFDLKALTEVREAVDALGGILAKALANATDLALEGAIMRARRQSQKYEHPDYVDLWDFCDKLSALWPNCAGAVSAVQKAIAGCVIANAAPNAQVSNSHGLSIYLPVEDLNPLYAKLEMSKGGWGKFLKAAKS